MAAHELHIFYLARIETKSMSMSISSRKIHPSGVKRTDEALGTLFFFKIEWKITLYIGLDQGTLFGL